MKIVADYKKRKELKEYLPHHEHWKLKSDRKSGSAAPTSNTVLAQLSPNSAAEGEGETKVSDNSSVGGKRSPVDDDEEEQENGDSETQPNTKKCKYENGDNEIRSHSETESTENGNGDGGGGGGA